MVRRLRVVIEDGLYHVTARGDRQEPIFEDDADRNNFLNIVARGMQRFDAHAHSYCLMSNHYHLVVQTPQANLSELMRHINGVFTQSSNRRHGRTGHVFQGRFHSAPVDRDAYFLEVCRYVDLNPVRAGLVSDAALWRWSSYRAHVDLSPSPAWLDSSLLHDCLAPSKPERDGPIRYRKFVKQGMEISEKSAAKLATPDVGRPLGTHESPRRNCAPPRPSVQWYLHANPDRNSAMLDAYVLGGYTMVAIAQALGITESRVSQVIKERSAQLHKRPSNEQIP